MLNRFIRDLFLEVPIESIIVKDRLYYEKILVEIIYRQVRRLKNKDVILVKVIGEINQFRELHGKNKKLWWVDKYLLLDQNQVEVKNPI